MARLLPGRPTNVIFFAFFLAASPRGRGRGRTLERSRGVDLEHGLRLRPKGLSHRSAYRIRAFFRRREISGTVLAHLCCEQPASARRGLEGNVRESDQVPHLHPDGKRGGLLRLHFSRGKTTIEPSIAGGRGGRLACVKSSWRATLDAYGRDRWPLPSLLHKRMRGIIIRNRVARGLPPKV